MENSQKYYQKNSFVASKMIHDLTFLMPVHDDVLDLDNVYILDGIAVRIWELIDGKRSLEAIKRIIVKEYKVEPREVEEDLTYLIRELEKKNCIRKKKIAERKKRNE